MQKLEEYYANELQYLAEAGADFARRHPQQAALLNPEQVKARDPHVERLFENFAFLTAGIRAKLDDELPELTRALLGLLCPQYVRPLPALVTLQLLPDYSQLTAPARVPADAFVEARPLTSETSHEPIKCQFRTCYPVDLAPIKLGSVRHCGPKEGGEGLEFTFTLSPGAKWEDMGADRLRLHLHGESHQLVYSVFYHLMKRARRVVLSSSEARAIAGRLSPVGFGREHEVIPYDTHAFPGFRLIHEYLCFPEKFLYVDITGLAALDAVGSNGDFTVTIWFDGELPPWWSRTLSTENFPLFCTPAINLFPAHAYPIDYDQRQSEYAIHIAKDAPDAYQVHSVRTVVGRPRGEHSDKLVGFRPFFDFRHNAEVNSPYYQITTRASGAGAPETVLTLTMPEGARHNLPELELSIDVEAFNGDYPQRLGPGDICFRADRMPRTVSTVRNLAPPTPVRWAGGDAALDWQFISQLALNHLGLTDIEAMVSNLRLYDWTGDPANARRLEGITNLAVSKAKALMVRDGAFIQGVDVIIDLDESCFTDLGDAYLLAEVLRHYLSLYATINSFVRVLARCVNSKEEWRWPPLDGRQTTI